MIKPFISTKNRSILVHPFLDCQWRLNDGKHGSQPFLMVIERYGRLYHTSANLPSRVDMGVIKDYVSRLVSRGLRAVILTGGGEPTLYPHINELIAWLLEQNLRVALITNGTLLDRVDTSLLQRLTWIRVSVNLFDDWEQRISVPPGISQHVMLGMSYIHTSQHESSTSDLQDIYHRIKLLANRLEARYIRLLPNCLLNQDDLLKEHTSVDAIVKNLDDSRFFHQGKIHETPTADLCHQSFFRPYLSEEPFPHSNTSGSVFPCDSVVLNQEMEHFNEIYAVCTPDKILDYLDGKIPPKFQPKYHCTGCVFASTVNMLERYINGLEDRFEEFTNKELQHTEFV